MTNGQIIANDEELDNFVRETTIGELLNWLDKLVQYNPANEKMAKSFETVLLWGAGLFDDLDNDICHKAVCLAWMVVRADARDGIDKSIAKEIADDMAGLAYYMLDEAERAGEWDSTRARLETIRDTCPEYGTPAPQSFSIEAMLSDTVLKERLVKWAVASAYNRWPLKSLARPDVPTKTTHEVAMYACKHVCAFWRETIFRDVLAQLEAANNKAAAE